MRTSIILAISILLFSCSKEKEEEITPTTDNNSSQTTNGYPNYSKLSVGNYWVYEQFDVDTLGNATTKNLFDSCYVEKDTLINGNTYFKMVRPRPYFSGQFNIYFLRDSSHYIVDNSGLIFFSSQDFSSLFNSDYYMVGNDTSAYVTTKMHDKDITVNTPSGNYTTSNYRHTFYMYPNYSFAGSVRTINTRYAENIGIVIETLPFFLSNPNYIERRLIRYNVNN